LVLIAAIGIWLVYALAGLRAYEVVYEKPPAFVDTYAKQLATSESGTKALSAPLSGPLSKKDKNIDFSKEEALMHRVFFEGESLDLILPLFTYPEKAQRVKVASAFAAFNIEFTHNEESGYPDIRRQFWLDAKAHMPDIENALYEALITSAEEGRKNRIPYTIAWLPGQDQKTVELLTWAAQHHSDWWVRRFSVYFVIKFGQNERGVVPQLFSLNYSRTFTQGNRNEA
jgi:hypothetical protein